MTQTKVIRECFFSQACGTRILDCEGLQVGKLQDMAVKWNGISPLVTCIKYAKGLDKHFAATAIQEWDEQTIVLKYRLQELSLKRLTEEELYVRKWLLDKQIIDFHGSKLVRVNDIQVSWVQHNNRQEIVLAGVDVGIRGLFRRLGLEFLVKGQANKLIGWQYLLPLEKRTDNLFLREGFKQLSQLHPADIAEIMEGLSQNKRQAIIRSLDNIHIADVLTALDLKIQLEIVESLGSVRTSDILQEMSDCVAADILGELPAQKSNEILNLMQQQTAAVVRELMRYPKDTAGAVMTKGFIALTQELSVQAAINYLQKKAVEAKSLHYIYITDSKAVLQGVVTMQELITVGRVEGFHNITVTANPHRTVLAVLPHTALHRSHSLRYNET